jgi:hypothetical protein
VEICRVGEIYFWKFLLYISYKIMRDICITELSAVSGSIWCTWNGYPGNGAGNQIEIEGDDCSILKQTIQVSHGSFDVGGFVIGTSASIAGGVASYATATAFGFGVVASGGIGIGLAVLIGLGYATTHR